MNLRTVALPFDWVRISSNDLIKSASKSNDTTETETEIKLNKSLNEFVTIEKAEPESGDKHSSEVIIHINHDKK